MENRHDKAAIPDDLVYLLTSDRVGHIASIRPDGAIATHLMWIDWDGEHVLASSPVGSRKGANWRANAHTSVSVEDRDDPWRFVIVRGRVTDIRPDDDLVFIDRMAMRYTGRHYPWRAHEREIFVITPERIHYGHGGRR